MHDDVLEELDEIIAICNEKNAFSEPTMTFREYRDHIGRSLNVMAAELQVSNTTIKNWQRGFAISYKNRKKFIEAYNYDPLHLGIPLENRGREPTVCFTGKLKRLPRR